MATDGIRLCFAFEIPHPGRFKQRVRIHLTNKELAKFAVQKSAGFMQKMSGLGDWKGLGAKKKRRGAGAFDRDLTC
jgi:hypothetical protein